MNENNLPPADAPEWGESYNFAWFKFHHLENLKTCTKAITKEPKKLPLGKALSQDAIKRLLYLTDQLIQFARWLPNSGGEEDEMDKIIRARKNFESNYVNKEPSASSFWHAQEIDMMATGIADYMDTMCEDE